MALSDENRVHPDLDAWVIPNFAQDVLGFNPTETLARLSQYPQRNMGDAITPFEVQWVDGTNEALHYRGNDLKRGKIWLQRGDPEEDGVRKYGYTGWQHRVGMATADVARCDPGAPGRGQVLSVGVAAGPRGGEPLHCHQVRRGAARHRLPH